MMNGWDGADWIWMTFMMIAFWGSLVAVVVFAIKGFGDTQRPRHQRRERSSRLASPRATSPRRSSRIERRRLDSWVA
jgi:hypothetical protein